LRQEAADLEDLLTAAEKLEDSRAYIDRLEKVLALRDYGACLGPFADRCHHATLTYPGSIVPGQRQPPLAEVIGDRTERKSEQKRRARENARRQGDE